jgi:SWI/SNF-related matrix-associated actin-dependent regulator 1 of chromatin subfamily A
MVRVQDLVTQRAFIVEQKKAYTYYGDKTKYRHIFRFLDESGSSNIPELTDKIRASMLRRKKDQVLDLPEKIVSVMECEFSPEWKRAYESAFDSYIEWIKNNPDPKRDLENVLSARDLVEMGKMKQVCSLSKVERMVSDIESATEEGQKVIVFSQYMETIKTIEAQLRAKGIACVSLTGESGMNERQDAVDAFQENEKIKVFIANIKAGGVGITLTAASIVMFADLEWSPEVHAQAEDRAHRYGQEGTVNVYYYIQPETIEVENMGMLEDKAELIQAILEGQNASRKGRNGVSEYMKALAQKVTNRAG